MLVVLYIQSFRRGFGFVTFQKLEQTETCFADGPHIIDGSTIELKRATPKEAGNKPRYTYAH